MFRRIFFVLIATVFFGIAGVRAADDSSVNLYLFWSATCPHCAHEKEFLAGMAPDYPNLTIHEYEINNLKNGILLQRVGQALRIDTATVPVTIIGNSYIPGFGDAETTGKTIREIIEKYGREGDPDPVGAIIGSRQILSPTPTLPLYGPKPEVNAGKNETAAATSAGGVAIGKISLPLLGTVDPKNVSLPILTFVIALLDGFNPCAMWTLLFLISLLLGMPDRRRMWILGIAFIATSALVYFLFLSAWLNLFLFLGFVVWIRVVIGLVALVAGAYYLKDYFTNKTGACNVMGNEKRQRVFEQLKTVTQTKGFFLALGGIIALAIAVNMVELVCSAGLPAIYTQVLSLADLPRWQYYLYLIFYILVFMVDDLFVFFTAMITLKAVGIESRFARASHLAGGILMLLIGLLLLFKPEILMFG